MPHQVCRTPGDFPKNAILCCAIACSTAPSCMHALKIATVRCYARAVVAVFLQPQYHDGSPFLMLVVPSLSRQKGEFQLPALAWVHCTCKYGIKQNHTGLTCARYTAYLCAVFRSCIQQIIYYSTASESNLLPKLICILWMHSPLSRILHFPPCYVFLVRFPEKRNNGVLPYTVKCTYNNTTYNNMPVITMEEPTTNRIFNTATLCTYHNYWL